MRLLTRTAVAAAFLIGLALAPSASAADDSQPWTGVSATVKLADKWRLSEDVTVRFSDRRDGLYEIESNTLLGYRPEQDGARLGRVHARPQLCGRPTSRSQAEPYMYWTVAEGGQAFKSEMPAFKDKLSKKDIWAVIAYVRAGLPRRSP